MGVAASFVGEAGFDFNAQGFQGFDFFRVVRQQFYPLDIQVGKHGGQHGIIAQVSGKTQMFVGFDCIGALILQVVSANFIE